MLLLLYKRSKKYLQGKMKPPRGKPRGIKPVKIKNRLKIPQI